MTLKLFVTIKEKYIPYSSRYVLLKRLYKDEKSHFFPSGTLPYNHKFFYLMHVHAPVYFVERRSFLCGYFFLFMRMVFCNYSYDVINFWYASSISFCRTVLQFQADFTNICIIDFVFYLRMKRDYLFVCLIGVLGSIWECFTYMERLLLSVKGYKFWP